MKTKDMSLDNECKYTLDEKDANAWQCSKCACLWMLSDGTPKENKMRYCPECGRRIVN